MHVFLVLVIFVCYLCGIEFMSEGISIIPFVGCMAVIISWVWFSYYASNTEVVLDKANSKFIFSSKSYFGKNEEYQCDLGDLYGVVLERELDHGEGLSCYRIGFVTKDGAKYPSKIFIGDFKSSVKKAYTTIQKHISSEINDEC